MCTLVLHRRPGHPWPLAIAANRDEMADRPWLAPGRHWPDRPEVFAGLDRLAGGSWLGVNDHGVFASVLNRRNSLGPAPGLRSRGELVLDALDHADAAEAARALADIDARAWRGFNLVVADDRDAFWIRGSGPDGPARPHVAALPAGTTMLTASDANDATDPRIALHLPRWRERPPPAHGHGDWSGWEELLSSRDGDPDRRAAMNFRLPSGFGTVCSTIVALPAAGQPAGGDRTFLRFADGHPGPVAWRTLLPGPGAGGVATRSGATL